MSTIKVDTIQNTSGVQQYTAQITATMNGTGTIALQQSDGVSSVTDNGTGQYQFNFSNNFSAATYLASSSVCHPISTYWAYLPGEYAGGSIDNTRTTAQCKVGCYNTSYTDTPSVGLICAESN